MDNLFQSLLAARTGVHTGNVQPSGMQHKQSNKEWDNLTSGLPSQKAGTAARKHLAISNAVPRLVF
jgi:hypothetical protein